MALPAKIRRAPKRASRWRSQAHCNFVRGHGCVVPGCDGRPIEVAHVRLDSGAGIGQKPDDWRVVSMCRDHHAEQHRIGELTFWDHVAQRDPGETITEFIKASPRRLAIEAMMKERENV